MNYTKILKLSKSSSTAWQPPTCRDSPSTNYIPIKEKPSWKVSPCHPYSSYWAISSPAFTVLTIGGPIRVTNADASTCYLWGGSQSLDWNWGLCKIRLRVNTDYLQLGGHGDLCRVAIFFFFPLNFTGHEPKNHCGARDANAIIGPHVFPRLY